MTKTWYMGTHLRVFSEPSSEYQHDRISYISQRSLSHYALKESSLSIGRVKSHPFPTTCATRYDHLRAIRVVILTVVESEKSQTNTQPNLRSAAEGWHMIG